MTAGVYLLEVLSPNFHYSTMKIKVDDKTGIIAIEYKVHASVPVCLRSRIACAAVPPAAFRGLFFYLARLTSILLVRGGVVTVYRRWRCAVFRFFILFLIGEDCRRGDCYKLFLYLAT